MALDHGDLFFINRSGSTYKIEAVELGNYLTNNSLNDGTYIVNDGMLSVDNTGNPLWTVPVALHSANSPNNTILDFDENFIVESRGVDIAVGLNFPNIRNELLCTDQYGQTPGFDENNCGCIGLDFGYIADRLPCPDGGIVDDNGCLEINACSNGVLGFYGTNEACIDVNICNNGGIINKGGCIALDYSEILSNIVCSDSSGLLEDGTCITVNFEKVMAEMGLGSIRADDSIIIRDANNNITNDGDLTKGDVKLSVNPAKYEAPKINKIKASGACLSIVDNKDDLTVGDVEVNMSEACLINYIKTYGGSTGDGTGGNPVKLIIAGNGISRDNGGNLNVSDVELSVKVCSGANSGLTFGNNGCLKLNIIDEDTGCMSDPNHTFIAERLYTAKSGGGNDPGIVFGVEQSAGDTSKWWIGMAANQNNGSMQFITGRGWENYDECGGNIPKSDAETPEAGSYGSFFSVAVGYNVLPNFKVSGLIGGHGDNVVAWIDTAGAKYDENVNCNKQSKKYMSLPAMEPDGKGKGCKVGNDDQKRRPDSDQLDQVNVFGFAEGKYDMYQTGDEDDRVGRRNRLGFDANSHSTNRFQELTSADARVGFGLTESDRVEFIENVMDRMGTLNSEGGLMRFALKQNDSMPAYPHMYIDVQELMQVAPSLIEYDWGPGSTREVYDDDGNLLGEEYVDNLDEVGVVAVKPHYRSLTMLSLVAHKIRKKQVEELQTKLDALEARLDAAGIP